MNRLAQGQQLPIVHRKAERVANQNERCDHVSTQFSVGTDRISEPTRNTETVGNSKCSLRKNQSEPVSKNEV